MDLSITNRVEPLVYRFDHAITESDIFRWLSNFEQTEWGVALTILENVVYYSSDRIFQILETYLRKNMMLMNVFEFYLLEMLEKVVVSWHIMPRKL